MQILAGAAGAVVCLGPAALAAKKTIVEYGQCVDIGPMAWAASTAQDWMDCLRYSVKFGMGRDGYKPMSDTEKWYTHSNVSYDRVTLRQKGRLMSKEEKYDWWLRNTAEGIEYQARKQVEAECGI